MIYNKKAFTLVELLVAMFLFAMLAVMIIPNVTQNAEKQLFVTQIKKVQNDIQQAMLLMLSQNQGSLQTFCSGANASECFTKAIAERLEKRVAYNQDDIKDAECAGDQGIKELQNACMQAKEFVARKPIFINKKTASFDTNKTDEFYAVNLTNGATISSNFNPVCNYTGDMDKDFDSSINVNQICGYIEVDLNAGKAPNMVGKDIHYFWIVDRDGIVPFGEIDKFTCEGKNATDAKRSLGCTFNILQEGKITYY